MFEYHDAATEDEINVDAAFERGVEGIDDGAACEVRGLEEDGAAGGGEEDSGEGVLRGIWGAPAKEVEPDTGIAVVGVGEEEGREEGRGGYRGRWRQGREIDGVIEPNRGEE